MAVKIVIAFHGAPVNSFKGTWLSYVSLVLGEFQLFLCELILFAADNSPMKKTAKAAPEGVFNFMKCSREMILRDWTLLDSPGLV